MYEMWKRKQIHEDARKMYRTKISVIKVSENVEGAIWEVLTLSEERTGRVRCWYGAESVPDMRGKEWDRN